MKIYGIGTDIVSVDRIKKSLKNKKLLNRLFSKGEILKCNNLKNSYIVPGEAESFFSSVDLDNSTLDKYFSDLPDSNKKNIDLMINNLDDLPFPDWSYYTSKYPLRNNFFSLNEKIAIPLLGTRGCPYSCFNYCTYPLQQGRKVRARSVENIIQEINSMDFINS